MTVSRTTGRALFGAGLLVVTGISGIAQAEEVCALTPAGGVVATTGRRRPEIALGKSQLFVVHRSPRGAGRIDGYNLTEVANKSDGRSDGGPDCSWAEAAVALPLPLGSKPAETLVAPDDSTGCASAPPDPLRLVRGADAALIACAYPVNLSWGCRVFGAAAPGFGFAEKWHETAIAAGVGVRDGTLFAAAIARDSRRMVGFVSTGGGPIKKEILSEIPDDLELAGAEVRVEPQSATAAQVTIVPAGKGKALRLVMNDKGARSGAATRLARPEPPGALRVEMRKVGKTPRLFAVAAGRPAAPVGGLPPDVASFGPSLAHAGERWLLAWSEGMGKSTKLRLARLDPTTLAVGAPIAISTADREAGFASLDAVGGRTVVAWDEKSGDRWEVRVAEVVCK